MSLEPNKAFSAEQLAKLAVIARQSGANTDALKNYLSSFWHTESQKSQSFDNPNDSQKALQSIIRARTIAEIYGNLFGDLKNHRITSNQFDLNG